MSDMGIIKLEINLAELREAFADLREQQKKAFEQPSRS